VAPAPLLRSGLVWQARDLSDQPGSMTLPGLAYFAMVGQWGKPGIDLPIGSMTAYATRRLRSVGKARGISRSGRTIAR
jgi:hypothetical protein